MNSGDPERDPLETIHLLEADHDRRKENVDGTRRESDPPIVVRDGRTDHKAKGRAERQDGQSTHARERNTPAQSVSRTLSALRAKAERDPKHRFRALGRLLDRRMLGEAFRHLNTRRPPGSTGFVMRSMRRTFKSIWKTWKPV